MRAADTVFTCREAAAELFHVPEPERVVFTMNATHALNIAIHSLVSPGDPVVISGYEHNSVTRPLHALGAQVRVAESPLFEPEAAVSAFRRALRARRRSCVRWCRTCSAICCPCGRSRNFALLRASH